MRLRWQRPGEYVMLREHLEALRVADDKFREERDRRYAEVNVEKEKALKIKETADLAALQLAREIQTYKDEKANELREQISSERGLYASQQDLSNVAEKLEAMIKPLVAYVNSNQGRGAGASAILSYAIAAAGIVVAIVALVTR